MSIPQRQPSTSGRFNLWIVLILATHAATLYGEDVAVVRNASGMSRIPGEILSYTGRELKLRHPSGREESYDAVRVVQVFTDWNEDCVAGDTAYADYDFQSAVVAYRAAFRSEQRSWAKRRILDRIVWCLRNTNQIDLSIEAFLLLYESDPTTQYIGAIPVSWIAEQPNAQFVRKAQAWLRDRKSPVAQLIAASWLLPTADRAEALQALRGINTDDARIGFLAAAQLWRSELGTATSKQIDGWEARIQAMPASIRPGPIFTVGLAWSQQQSSIPAALAFARLPILYPEHRALAAAALMAAGRELEKLDRHDEAAVLYRELLTEFAESPVSGDARTRLLELQTEPAK